MYDSMDIGEIDTITTNENLIDIRDKYEYVLSHKRRKKYSLYIFNDDARELFNQR